MIFMWYNYRKRGDIMKNAKRIINVLLTVLLIAYSVYLVIDDIPNLKFLKTFDISMYRELILILIYRFFIIGFLAIHLVRTFKEYNVKNYVVFTYEEYKTYRESKKKVKLAEKKEALKQKLDELEKTE